MTVKRFVDRRGAAEYFGTSLYELTKWEDAAAYKIPYIGEGDGRRYRVADLALLREAGVEPSVRMSLLTKEVIHLRWQRKKLIQMLVKEWPPDVAEAIYEALSQDLTQGAEHNEPT